MPRANSKLNPPTVFFAKLAFIACTLSDGWLSADGGRQTLASQGAGIHGAEALTWAPGAAPEPLTRAAPCRFCIGRGSGLPHPLNIERSGSVPYDEAGEFTGQRSPYQATAKTRTPA